MPRSVAIVGAGIIGTTCALELGKAGADVTVIDPGTHDSAASHGNAGGLGYAEILPIASGNILRKVPGWLTSPVGPISISPSHLYRLAPWFGRFIAFSRPKAFAKGVEAIARLNGLSRALCFPLYQYAGMQQLIRAVGAIHLYQDRHEMQRAFPGWKIRANHGVKFRHIEPSELYALEPDLARIFSGATFIEDWHLVSNPSTVVDQMAKCARQHGVRFIRGSVININTSGSLASIEMSHSPSPLKADNVVLAAGAWSGSLAARLGDNIPVEAERGYNTTIEDPGVSITSELIFGEHGFVATQLGCGLRIGGGAEFSGLATAPNYRRAEIMLAKATRFLPDLQSQSGIQWMGCRPSMPDNVPVIGSSTAAPGVFYAFGHGHLGLTQAPGTARLIMELVTGRETAIDIRPYSPTRFGRGKTIR